MLEIKFIRQNAETIQRIADQKGITVSISELLVWDGKKRKLLKETESLRETRNSLSKQFGQLSQQGKSTESELLKENISAVNLKLNTSETALSEAVTQYNALMILVPNIISPDTPIGRSDEDNVELRCEGEIPSFAFEPKDHVTLGEIHDIIDIPRGVKVAGKRNYFLKGNGLHLHRAVQQLTLDILTTRGFTALDVPLIVRRDALANTAFFPLGMDQTFKIANEDKWLVGTSEVPMVSYYSDEIIDVKEPIKLAAISLVFEVKLGLLAKTFAVYIVSINSLKSSKLSYVKMILRYPSACFKRLRKMRKRFYSSWSCLIESLLFVQEICRKKPINNLISRHGCPAANLTGKHIPLPICMIFKLVVQTSDIAQLMAHFNFVIL
jgi:seryl-tRNA synthetase